ncbi:uncharacterized protein [Dysidea avara]|uniref:uncharacterized protein n=1 Tax=Dysidea avara TaxID=196820 RepID=UPI00332DB648
MRHLHQKKSSPVMAGITNKISDGSASSTEKKQKEEQYSEIMLSQLHRDDTIKMDSNPSYGSYTGQGSNIAIQPNPSYGVNKRNNKITEDQYDYARPTELTKHPSHDDRKDDVNMESNPSYGIIRGEGNNNMGCDVTIEPPSYGVATRMANRL